MKDKDIATLEKKVDESKCIECSNPIVVGNDGSKVVLYAV